MLLKLQTANPTPSNPQELYRSQRYATAIYRSELATRLRQLGYEIERGRYGEFEIQGYGKDYLEASSPRRKQIKEYLEANRVSGSEAAEIGAHRTREKKAHLTPAEMQRLNLALAAQYANDPREIVSAAQARRQHSQELPAIQQRFARASEAVTFGRDRNIEREATVEERTLLLDALRRAMGEATLRDIRKNFESRVAKVNSSVSLTARTILCVVPSPPPGCFLFEQDNIAVMKSGQDLESPLVRSRTIRQFATDMKALSDSQWKAVREVLGSHDRITGLQGVAGSGKTTTLRAIRQAAEREGYLVEGFAPTSRAAYRLEEAGVSAKTLQRFLLQNQAADHSQRRLFVLDESSLASTRQVNDFFKRLAAQDRVLLVGDTRQHQAVDAGRPFQQMQEAGMRTAHLEQIVRQRDPELKQAVESLAKGDTPGRGDPPDGATSHTRNP